MQITLTPTTATVGTSVRVDGSGFVPSERIQLLVDGVKDSTFRPTAAGTFWMTIAAATTPRVSKVTVRRVKDKVVIASATLTVVAAPAPPPTTDTPAFGTRPLSGALSIVGQADLLIENKTLRSLGAGVIAVRIENSQRITIRNCDFDTVAECVYALASSTITIEDCRYSNITGPAQPRTGANVANFVQLNRVTGALIARNRGKGGDTEDIVSTYESHNCIVEDNHFEGTNWTSGSGSGIALCDGGGSGNVARRNKLLNPGQVGIFIAGGTNSRIENNIIVGERRTKSNVGMYVWNQSSSACSGHTVNGNRVRWQNEAGNANPYWNAGNCGAVAGANDLGGAATPEEIEALRVVL